MEKIILTLTILMTFATSKNFAMMDDSPDGQTPGKFSVACVLVPEKKFQQLFFFYIEEPLRQSRFPMVLGFNSFIAAKKVLCTLDQDRQNIETLKEAGFAVLEAQLLMAYKIICIRFSPHFLEESKDILQVIFHNLDWIAKKILKKIRKACFAQVFYSHPGDKNVSKPFIWGQIKDSILEDPFNRYIKLINESMSEYSKVLNGHEFSQQAFKLLYIMEGRIRTIADMRLRHDYLQIAHVIRQLVINFVIEKDYI